MSRPKRKRAIAIPHQSESYQKWEPPKEDVDGSLAVSIGPIWDMGWDSSGMGWNTGLDLTRSIKTESFGVLVRFLTLGGCLVMLPLFYFLCLFFVCLVLFIFLQNIN